MHHPPNCHETVVAVASFCRLMHPATKQNRFRNGSGLDCALKIFKKEAGYTKHKEAESQQVI